MVKLAGPLNPVHLLGRLATKSTVKPVLSTGKDILLGAKKLVGPLRGSRLRWSVRDAAKLKGYRQLSNKELANLPANKRARVSWLKIRGNRIPAIRKTSYGGVVGVAQRHPFLTGGGLLLANELRKTRSKAVGPAAPAQEMAVLQQQMQPYYQPLPTSGGSF